MNVLVRANYVEDNTHNHSWRDIEIRDVFHGFNIFDPGGKSVLQKCRQCGGERVSLRLRCGLWAWFQDLWYGRPA